LKEFRGSSLIKENPLEMALFNFDASMMDSIMGLLEAVPLNHFYYCSRAHQFVVSVMFLQQSVDCLSFTQSDNS